MREQFEKLPEIADSLSEHIYFGGDGFYHSSLVNFQGLVNWLNGAWYAWQAKAQAVQEGLRKNQEKVKVYELHVKTLKQIHENEFNEKSESSYILGNLDGFFECLESDLGEIK